MPLIVTEGPIGAGKTSLSRLLAQHLGARLVLEAADYDFVERPDDRKTLLDRIVERVQVA